MKYIGEMYDNSETFKLFTENAGVGNKEIQIFIEGLKSIGKFDDTTFKFIEVLSENKRFMFIKDISVQYQKLYQ